MPDLVSGVADVARTGDKDMFLSTLFAPEERQPHLFALQAFAVELARIPTLVSEPQIGEIRLQWWADTLQHLGTDDANHPVAQALAEAVRKCGLPLQPLQQMIEARRFDLYADAMPDTISLEAYFGETLAALIQLHCLVLDAGAAPRAAEAAGYAGVALGIARAMITPQHGKLIPPGSSRETVLALAEQRLSQARAAIAALPLSLMPAFLPAATTQIYLGAARAGRTYVPQWRRQWRIWRAAKSEKI